MKRIITMTDAHCPFQDERAVATNLNVINDLQPDEIVLLGDMADFYSISRFLKNPQRHHDVQYDLDSTHELFRNIRAAAPDAKIRIVPCNHGDRWTKYIWANAPNMWGQIKDLRSALALSKFGIKPCADYYSKWDVIFKHGEYVRKHSAYTARAELDTHWKAGVSGHTHRLGVHYRRVGKQVIEWAEGGCLCTLKMGKEYAKRPDWHHGFVIVTKHPKQDAQINQYKINPKYTVDVNGKLYKP